MMEAREWLADVDEDILCADDFDEAIIGYVEQFGRPPIALYDVHKLIEIMVTRDDMTEEDAWEHYHYNMIGGYVGDYTPAFAYLKEKDE